MAGSQDFADDPRNAKALVYVNGQLVPRAAATVSIFDSGYVRKNAFLIRNPRAVLASYALKRSSSAG